MASHKIPEEFADVRRLIHELADGIGVELTDQEPEPEPRTTGLCSLCGEALECREDGLIYCEAEDCDHHNEPHPTGVYLNEGAQD